MPASVGPFLRCLFAASVLLAATAHTLHGEGPSTPGAEVAARLAEAPDDAARDAILAAVDRSPATTAEVRGALQDRQQRAQFSGDLAAAEMLARYLEKLAGRDGDEDGVQIARVRLSSVYREYGEFQEASALLDPALAYFEAKHDVRRTVSALMGRGIIFIYQADYARALRDFQHALKLSEDTAYRDGAIAALNSSGEVFREQGEPARALEYYAQARQWLGDDAAWNNAFLFNNIAQSYLALGDDVKAAEYLERSSAIAEKTGQKPRAATALAILGDLHRQRGRDREAVECLERSLALARASGDPAAEGRADLALSEAAGARGDSSAAAGFATRSAASYRRANQPAGLGAALTALGHQQRVLGQIGEARASLAEAIEVTESVRERLAGGDLEAQKYFEGKVSPYQETVALLAAEPDAALAALQTAERAKARVLLDIVRRGSDGDESALSPTERARDGELRRRLAALDHRVTLTRAASAAAIDPAHPDDTERELRDARLDRDRFEQAMLLAHPQLAVQHPPAETFTSRNATRLTGGGKTALLEFVVTDDTTYLFVVTAGIGGEDSAAVHLFPLSVGRAELSRRAETLRAALADRGLSWEAEARWLYDALLKEAAPSWQGAAKLVIVPDGPLWNLPFQVLAPGPDRFLWEEKSISYVPSLTLLERSAGGPPATSTPRLLAFGNPALNHPAAPGRSGEIVLSDQPFVPLPEAERQVAAVAALYPDKGTRTYVGALAHEDTFKREASGSDILHFATHGTLNDQNPLYSYLLMAQTDLAPDEDGLLEARELMGLRLHARLAVLSACETGRGRVGAGEGLLGLSWAFLSAGCPAVVVSQWKVDSASSTDLMIGFHRRLVAGDTPAVALRSAGLELAKNPRFRHPFYWAPFVMVGLDQPVATPAL